MTLEKTLQDDWILGGAELAYGYFEESTRSLFLELVADSLETDRITSLPNLSKADVTTVSISPSVLLVLSYDVTCCIAANPEADGGADTRVCKMVPDG